MGFIVIGTRDHPPSSKDFIVLTVFNYFLKPGKKLEEKQAATARIRAKYPDKIPVVLVRRCYTLRGIQIEQILSLLVGVESNKRQFFDQVATLICPTKDLGDFKCWDFDFKTTMSLYYDAYKDNDGILYVNFNYEEGLPKYLPNIEDNNPKRESSRQVAKYIHVFERIMIDLAEIAEIAEMAERNSNDDQSEEERQTIAERYEVCKRLCFDQIEKMEAEEFCDDDWELVD